MSCCWRRSCSTCLEPLGALREAHRALHVGGTIGVVTWSPVAVVLGTNSWAEELDPPAPGRRSEDARVSRHAEMNTPDTLATLLEAAGFEAVRAMRRVEFRWTVTAPWRIGWRSPASRS